MADVLKHQFTSAKPDGPDTTVIRPSDWNAEHAFAGGGNGDLLVFDQAETDKAGWVAAGAEGAVLVSGGADEKPAWLPAGAEGALLVSEGETTAPGWVAAAEAGALLVARGVATKPAWVAPGADGALLVSGGADDPDWVDPGAEGAILLSNGAAAAPGWLPSGAAGQVLIGAGVTDPPAWSDDLPLAGDAITMPLDGDVVTTHKVGKTALTHNVATPILTIAIASGTATGGTLALVVVARDGAGNQDVATAAIHFALQRTSGGITTALDAIGTGITTKSHGGFDMTLTADADASSGTAVAITIKALSALVPTTLTASWRLTMLAAHGALS